MRRGEGNSGLHRVLVVDDEPVSCRTMERDLRQLGWRSETVNTLAAASLRLAAGSSASAFAMVLLDLNLPDGDGADLIPIIRQCAADAAIVVCSGYLTAKRCLRLNDLGVEVCLPKPIFSQDLRCLLRSVHAASASAQTVAALPPQWRLSVRERQIVDAAHEGLSRKEIAAALGISVATVATHWKRIFDKTGLSSERRVLAIATPQLNVRSSRSS